VGNIGNPVVNRLGTNIFWQKYWFSENFYSTKLHQYRLILLLVQIYLKYGLQFSKNVFHNFYWFNQLYQNKNKLSYYRWSNFFNDLSQTETKHRFRLKSGLFYKTKINLLVYNKWLIVILQWFEPDKRRSYRLKKLNQNNFKNIVISPTKNQNSYFKRFFNTIKLSTVGLNPYSQNYFFLS
jgi:hypothetical protein